MFLSLVQGIKLNPQQQYKNTEDEGTKKTAEMGIKQEIATFSQLQQDC